MRHELDMAVVCDDGTIYINPQQGPTTVTCKRCGHVQIVPAYQRLTDEDYRHCPCWEAHDTR